MTAGEPLTNQGYTSGSPEQPEPYTDPPARDRFDRRTCAEVELGMRLDRARRLLLELEELAGRIRAELEPW